MCAKLPERYPQPSRPSVMVLVIVITLLTANHSPLPTRRTHLSQGTHSLDSSWAPGLLLSLLPGPCFPDDPPGCHQVAANEQPLHPVGHEQHSVSTLRSSYSTSSCLVLSEDENRRFSVAPASPITLKLTLSLILGVLPRKSMLPLPKGPVAPPNWKTTWTVLEAETVFWAGVSGVTLWKEPWDSGQGRRDGASAPPDLSCLGLPTPLCEMTA